MLIYKTKKKKWFVSCNVPKKNRVGRSKNFFFDYFFYACFTLIGSLEGGIKLRVGIYLNKNL